MGNYQISLNQMAEFKNATDYGRKRIIKQQLNPDQFRIPWYQLPKARVKKSIELKGDLNPIHDGIITLMNRKPLNKRQETDKRVSIDALERYIKIKLPHILKEIDYDVIRPKIKSTKVSDVEILVAPEVIVKGILRGKTVFGGIKIHISKNKPFDIQQSKIVATTIVTYLENEVAFEKSEVIPELCFCLDIFSGRIVSAKENDESVYIEIKEICNEIKRVWDAV
jgi:hypothetical protein